MKLLRYGNPGEERPAILDQNGIVRDLSGVIGDIGPEVFSRMSELAAIDPATLPQVIGDVRIGPCFTGIRNFFCVGLNYVKHAQETNTPLPEEVVLFMKSVTAVSGPNDPIVLPNGSTSTDWEAELGVIIGRTAKKVRRKDALSYVAGYFAANDVSERRIQKSISQWVRGKSCDGFGPIGPWFVTADEIPDPQNLHIWLKVNGHTMQDSNTGDMIFDVAAIIEQLSATMTLHPGDIIITGTPSGVGMGHKPPVYLKEGDVVELGLDGLGTQKQLVIGE